MAMLTEAAAQGHKLAQYNLGLIYHKGQGVARNVDRAIELYTQAVRGGYALAYVNLGNLLRIEVQDVDGAEKAYRAAIEANPGYAQAHYNLGNLLKNERQDMDGAEKAYRAAIEADPRFAKAHSNLATLLYFKRAKKAEAEGDLARAAALYDEVIKHYTLGKGAEHEWTREAKADAARVRAALSRTRSEGGRKGAGTGQAGRKGSKRV